MPNAHPRGAGTLDEVLRHKTGRAALGLAGAAAIALALAACGGSSPEQTAIADPTSTPNPSASTSASPDASSTPSLSVSSAQGGAGGALAEDCSAQHLSDPPTAANLTAVDLTAAATATTLFSAASSCDSEQLISLATAHQTNLSFASDTAAQSFGLPENSDARYAALVKVLSTQPMLDTTSGHPLYAWPAVATMTGEQDDAAWQDVVDAGLLTQAESEQMRARGSGYQGWRVGIDGEKGTWQFMVAGK